MSAKSLVLRGMKLLRFDNVEGGSEPHIGAQLSGFPLLDYRLAASLHVGDYVELVLQSGRRLAGTIVSESSDYVVLQAGDDPPQRVARGSIASVTRQDVTRSARVEIPIAAPFDPTARTREDDASIMDEDRPEGRAGIAMVLGLCASAKYLPRSGGNCLVMTFATA